MKLNCKRIRYTNKGTIFCEWRHLIVPWARRHPHTPKLTFPVLPRAQWYLWLASPSLLASLENIGPPSSASLLPPPADEDLNTGLFHILLPQCALQITRIGDHIKQAWVKEWRDGGIRRVGGGTTDNVGADKTSLVLVTAQIMGWAVS